MKCVAILGGLGSQMLKYAFYLQLQRLSGERCYINTIPFYMQNMWNGFELDKIFGISEPDIVDFLDEEDLKVLSKSKQTYYEVSMDVIKKFFPSETCYWVSRGKVYDWDVVLEKKKNSENRWINTLKGILLLIKGKIGRQQHMDVYPTQYYTLKGNVLYDEFNHTSDRYFADVREELLNVFSFPTFVDIRNLRTAKEMCQVDSVALHIRRSDHLYDNGALFTRKYFEKSVKYIKEKVERPVFYVFSDDEKWCKDNLEELGLDWEEVRFVDWNTGDKSYRDMQLMTYCKHNVLCISSFSWWGYYLSKHKEKIVVAPKEYWYEVPVHF